jgi:hypothetical protein
MAREPARLRLITGAQLLAGAAAGFAAGLMGALVGWLTRHQKNRVTV